MKHTPTHTKDVLLNLLAEICSNFDLDFDGPGTHNFRKLPNRAAWNIYFRSQKSSNSALAALQKADTLNRKFTPLYLALRTAGFTYIDFKGGMADLSASFYLGWR